MVHGELLVLCVLLSNLTRMRLAVAVVGVLWLYALPAAAETCESPQAFATCGVQGRVRIRVGQGVFDGGVLDLGARGLQTALFGRADPVSQDQPGVPNWRPPSVAAG